MEMDVPPDIDVNFSHPCLSNEFKEVINEYYPIQSASVVSAAASADDDICDGEDENDIEVSEISIVSDVTSPIVQSRIRQFLGDSGKYAELSSDSDSDVDDRPFTSEPWDVHPTDASSFKLQKERCKKRCLYKFFCQNVIEHRLNMQEMQTSETDLLLIGQLQACGTSRGNVTRHGDRKRHRLVNYQFDNVDVCIDCFLFINSISIKYLKNIRQHMYTHGSTPRSHGNSKRKPHNALTYDDVQHIVQFIISYADRHGMPQPAAQGSSDGIPPIYLPSKDTYLSVYKTYVEVADEMNHRKISEPTFRNIWKECVPHIQFLTSRTDVCHLCEKFRRNIQDAKTEAEKLMLADGLSQHIRNAQAERGFYKDKCKEAQEELATNRSGQQLSHVHYTFDFAQSVLVPGHVRQEGALYFKSPLKVNWFGILNDGRPLQFNYLYSEGQSIGVDNESSHSANSVISMLDDFFSTYSEKEKSCFLNCDNCGGQNKNQVMTSYLCWRTMMGFHNDIYLHFMKPYHARCQIDGMFGLGRQKLRRHDVDSVSDVSCAITSSSNFSKCVLYEEEHCAGSKWVWRDWKKFLQQYFRPVPAIQQYYHFQFSSSRPGIVVVKETLDSDPKDICLLKRGKQVKENELPNEIESGGLSPFRQWYLYKNIRQFVATKSQDITAPKPSVSE